MNKRSNLRVRKLPSQRHLLFHKTKEPQQPPLTNEDRRQEQNQGQRAETTALLLLKTKRPLNLDSNRSPGVKTVKSRTGDNAQKQRPLLLLQTKKPLNLAGNQSLEVKTDVKS